MDQDDGHQSTTVPFSPTATNEVPETIESSDLSGHNTAYSANVPPRGRPTRLHVPPTSYRGPPSQQHQQQQQQQQDLANMGSPYYSSPQPQAQRQPQQYMSQPMSPAIYYPSYHPQSTPPTAYNVNQGYMGPPHTSVGPSMPVTPYAYSHHPYSRVSDHNIHPYAYHGMGGVTATPIPHYPEHDSQQMHPHGANMDMMASYGAMVATTAPPFGYSIPAYAPTPTAVFTPQYAAGPSYQQYNPQQSYSGGYAQSHPGHRPPSLNLSQQQQQASQQQPSQQPTPNVQPQVPPSPIGYPNLNQPPSTRGYSPIVTSPSPGLPSNSGFSSLGVSTSGSGMFSVGPSGAGSGALSARGTISGYGSNGSGDNANRSQNASASNVASGGQNDSAQGRRPSTYPAERPPSSPHGAATPLTWPARQEPGQAQVSGKAERSEWVMWVGNVPGDATTEELQAFFSQTPAPPNEGQDGTGVDSINLPTGSQHSKEGSTSTRESERGVTSVFLISRSNCAFVNYVSEEALNRGVEKFNGKPLRSPQVDPRCPKLVCRVRKKGDDVKAGVGGQRGAGMHTRWVKEKAAKGEGKAGEVTESDRPPLIRGGPILDVSKKSSSGSNVSFASTNSSLLVKHFPVRYFILKSLTQHDLDISVEKCLWATQTHNEDTLEQAYRTSKSVYLIFSVNKSGEFFGYAKMDGPIRQGEPERTPSVEWASRDATTGSNSARNSPVNSRGPPQPTIEEETEGNEQEPATSTAKSENVEPEGNAVVDTRHDADGPRQLSMPAEWNQRAADDQPSGTKGKKDPPAQHASEPAHALQHFAAQVEEAKTGPLQISEPLPPKASISKPGPSSALSSNSVSHLFTNVLQDSPDPLTPGEDRKLHSLENAPQTLRGQTKSTMALSPPAITEQQATAAKGGRVSAPAEMANKHRPLSLSTPSTHPETLNEGRHSTLWSLEHSIEEEDEGAKEDRINIPTSTQSLPPEGLLGFSASSGEIKLNTSALSKLASQLSPVKNVLIDLVTGSHHPTSAEPPTADGVSSPTQDDKSKLPIGGGREEGWGTPFKVKWVRTDPLPFHRTRHLRNPWNHDREVKVSRDGTEIEPTVGQRLIEEWDRTDQSIVPTRSGVPPRTPLSPTSPTVPTHIPSRGRGRGRMASAGYLHADIG